MSRFEKNATEMEDCWEECVNNTGDHQFAWADLAPNSEEDRLNQVEEKEEMEELCEEYVEDERVSQSFPDENSDTLPKAFAVAKTAIVDTSQLNEMIRKMNDQQYAFLMFIRNWCLKSRRGENTQPFFIHLTGSAGTGKSHLVRTIYQLATKILQQTSENSGDVVLLTSFTGSAAYNIGGYTIHNLFSIPLDAKPPYRGLKNKGLLEIQQRLSDIRILIIDEISMVDKTLLLYIHGRLKQIKQLLKSSHAPFGNISILAVGDFFQLAPIMKQMLCLKSHDGTDYLWEIFTLYTLEEIIRQKGDTQFSELLNRLRVRTRDGRKVRPLLDDDEEFLKNREIDNNPHDANYPHDVYHLFATWKNVHKHNKLMLDKLCKDIRTIIAVDVKYQFGKKYKLDIPRKKETSFQPRELQIAVGARAMLKTNLDVQDGLCNSSIGTVVHIENGRLPHGQPECIYIKFDDTKVGMKLKKTHVYPSGVPSDSVPITPLSYVLTQGKGSKVIRYQYPLILAWAGTIHSSQGRTLKKVVVSFDRMFAKGQAYVALSRVTNSEGLFILDLNSNKIYCDERIIQCYAKMPRLDIDMNVLPEYREVTIVHHNVEGLFQHKQDIIRCKQLFPCDIFCVTESHCPQMPKSDDLIPGYVYTGRSRKECYNKGQNDCIKDLKNAEKGGVGIFVCHQLLAKEGIDVVDLWFNEIALEHTGIMITNTNNNNSVIILVIYCPPKLQSSYVCNEIGRLLSNIPNNTKTIIVGDFNEDASDATKPIQSMLLSHGYKQVISEPTTCDQNGKTLDHLYISHTFEQNYQSGTIPTHFSYHDAIYLTY